ILNMFIYFFFYEYSTTEIHTLSLHDALPILSPKWHIHFGPLLKMVYTDTRKEVFGTDPNPIRKDTDYDFIYDFTSDWMLELWHEDRKSTRLNSSHVSISYAVFCLKKKTQHTPTTPLPVANATVASRPPHDPAATRAMPRRDDFHGAGTPQPVCPTFCGASLCVNCI